MKYLFLLLIFITHIGLAMDLKRAKNVILNDKDYQFATQYLGNKKSTPEQIVNKVLLPIAYHESKLDPTAVQKGGGPGRGMYQFEGPSLRTALRRSFNKILSDKGMEMTNDPVKLKKAGVPAYMIKAYNDPDASKLSPGQQSAILLFDYLQKPNANIDEVTQGNQTINSFWYNSHWSGSQSSDFITKMKRKASFSAHYDEFMRMDNKEDRVQNIKQPPEKGNLGGILDAR